jgi:hypothetical protein
MTKARDLANIISGGFTADDIPNLDTAKLTTGTIASARIDNNSLSAITALPSGVGGIALQAVQTTGFTAVAGRGYPCNTTSAGFTVTLPATPSAGDQVQLVDYAGTFDTNALTINPNGEDIEGGTGNFQLTGEREGVILTYIDSTQGWIATSGINEGTDALEPLPYSVDFLVIAGGGGGGTGVDAAGRRGGGGGGAGGYRNSYSTETSGRNSSSESSLTFISGTLYTITVGAGGTGAPAAFGNSGQNGENSSISGSGITTITSNGGGYGTGDANGNSGGSGGGAMAGTGAYPPQYNGGSGTANQGFDGANGNINVGGGGGGASENGDTDGNGQGGDGLASSITGSSITRAGGGGGGGNESAGGDGGGGVGAPSGGVPLSPGNGTANTGGGGGGGNDDGQGFFGANGGSGVVILRMSDASYSGITTGSPTVTTNVGGTDTVLVFTGSGSYTG